MIPYFLFLQQSGDSIKQKLESAPNKGYEIGIAIGTFLPLIILVAIAYWLYRAAKNRKDF